MGIYSDTHIYTPTHTHTGRGFIPDIHTGWEFISVTYIGWGFIPDTHTHRMRIIPDTYTTSIHSANMDYVQYILIRSM